MIYFFHHYELPVIVQQAQLQQMFIRSPRNNNNNNRQADNGQAATGGIGGTNAGADANQQMNRENQQAPTEAPAAAPTDRPTNNAANMFVIRGAYRRRVNHLVERLRNNFYSNVLGTGLVADNNNNNANNLQNHPGFNNLTRSLRLLNLLFPNRPILNVRIINVRSASASATVANIIRTAEGNQSQPNPEPAEPPSDDVRPEQPPESASSSDTSHPPANDASVEPDSSIKHRETVEGDVNNSVNVMQSSTNGDGESSQTTSSSNEQC